MICIRPMAPFRDRARTSPALSTRMTDAYPMLRHGKATGRLGDEGRKGIERETARTMRGRRRSLGMRRIRCTALVDATIATCTLSPREIASLPSCSRPSRVKRSRAGLAAALDRRCARRPSRDLVGTEEWCCVRSNRGMTDFSGRTITITPPWSTQAVPCR